MPIRDGFPGQRLLVLPRPMARKALSMPGTARLLVTDCGHYPHARNHGHIRPDGSHQAIVMICSEGAGSCRIGGGEHLVEAGQALIIPPDTPHEYQADPRNPWTIWWVHLAGADVLQLLAAATVDTQHVVIDVGDLFQAVGLVEAIIHRMQRDETQSNLLGASGAAWYLMALLAADRRRGRRRGSPVGQAQQYLRDNLTEQVSVAELAALAGLSASHFADVFRRETGLGIVTYQTRLRMATAREMLDTTDDPVAVIAQSVGYPDAFYFSRRFRAVHQLTPTEYRAQSKG
ncbi:AraC-like DNA-binding protein/quercetin dioxygenase-like cupin family protein [Nakamurella sp. UYEF19]|uniref:AraC family transcriptional regulator n=1 Tax=Nakamurella sp. UYEF19 TaxID=1756392 RepID=UPI003391523D